MMKKMMTRKIISFLPAALLLTAGCGGERPSAPDGEGIISVVIVDTTGTLPGAVPGEATVVSGAAVSLQSRSHEYVEVTESNDGGTAGFYALPAGDYSLFARRELLGAQKKVFTGFTELHVSGAEMVTDTIYVSTVTVNSLMINEIYYCGGDYSKYYFYDQFVELYNSSQDTLYLDGCILTRNFPTIDIDIEGIDYVRALYAFQFPGTPVTGREHPIYPGQYVVVAADAVDHSRWADAIDLSGADWEFFNPLGSDYDVPGIPNVTSIHPDNSRDFMINLVHNAVVFTTGEEFAYESYINSAGYERIRIILPLYTVIDGVEYAPNSDRTKELTMRVDAGFAGLGCTKYSGQSTERREIGFDVNNSTFDFILIPSPTPGYTHVQ